MDGAAFCDLVQRYAGSEVSRASLYEYINNAQNRILGSRAVQAMRIVPDPVLTTVNGTFEYAASTSLFRSVGGVKDALTTYDVRLVTRVYTWVGGQMYVAYNQTANRPNELTASGEVNARVDLIPSKKPLSADAKIIFWEENNPGATTLDWRAEAYRWPTQFTSEAVDLEVPEGFQHTLLLWEVLQALGVQQFGNPSQPIQSLIQGEEARFLAHAAAAGRTRPRRTLPAW